MKLDAALLLAFAERLERADAALAPAVESEAAAAGFDPAALRQAVREADMAPDERARCRQHLDAYRVALGLLTWAQLVEATVHDHDTQEAAA